MIVDDMTIVDVWMILWLLRDEMRLPWLVLLLSPFFRCRIIPPVLNLIRFLNRENSRHRHVFRFGSVLLPFSDSVATMRTSFHIPMASGEINRRHSTCVWVHITFGLRARLYTFLWRNLCANTEYRVVSPAPNQSLWYPFRCPLPRLLHATVLVRECTCENVARSWARSAIRGLAREKDRHRVLPE